MVGRNQSAVRCTRRPKLGTLTPARAIRHSDPDDPFTQALRSVFESTALTIRLDGYDADSVTMTISLPGDELDTITLSATRLPAETDPTSRDDAHHKPIRTPDPSRPYTMQMLCVPPVRFERTLNGT